MPVIGNKLLRALDACDAKLIVDIAMSVPLPLRQVLKTSDAPITHCYFIEAGVVAMIAVLADGERLEVGLVGSEGMIGTPVLLGAESSPVEAVVLLAGSALRVEAKALLRIFDENVAIRRVILKHVQAMHVQIAQTAACNGRHEIEQRLARWLLMVDDKFAIRPLPLTQEYVGMMLGVRRQQVSIAANILQKAGFISYRQGQIIILDRAGLELIACECYGIVAHEFSRLLAPAATKSAAVSGVFLTAAK